MQFGRYELVSRLGHGGMGETWKARVVGAAGVTRQVVIKRILSHKNADERFIKAFIDEARITSTLNHGNIAQVVEFGEVDGEYFLAIEYVQGKTLEQVLAQSSAMLQPRLPVQIACLITCELLEALQYAHTRTDEAGRPLGIVHRDISPDNVLLALDGQVKVVDFGVAKARLEGRPTTEPGTLKGKWNYFSPEQARTEEVDARSDLFAVGIVLYRMLCGRLPFDGHLQQALFQVISGKFPPPQEVAPELPDTLVDILLTALQSDREKRFQSAQEFELKLRGFLAQTGLAVSGGALRTFLRELFADTGEVTAEGPTLQDGPEPSPEPTARPTVTPHPSQPSPHAHDPTLVRASSSAETIDAKLLPDPPKLAQAEGAETRESRGRPIPLVHPLTPAPVVRQAPQVHTATPFPSAPRSAPAAPGPVRGGLVGLSATVAIAAALGAAVVVTLVRPAPPRDPGTTPWSERPAAAAPVKGIELRRLTPRALFTDELPVDRAATGSIALELERHNLAAGLQWALAATTPRPMGEGRLATRGVPLFLFGKSTVAPLSRTGWSLQGGDVDAVRMSGLVQASAFEFRPFERATEAPEWNGQVTFAAGTQGIELPVQVLTSDSGGFVKLRWPQTPGRASFAFGPADALREAVVACRGLGAGSQTVQRLEGMRAVSFDAPVECAVGLVDDPAATGTVRVTVNRAL